MKRFVAALAAVSVALVGCVAASGSAQSSTVAGVSSPQWNTTGYHLNRAGTSPYLGNAVVPLKTTTWGTVDKNGVLNVSLHGEPVYHPVNSAWWMNQMISSYKVTGNKAYLDQAEATARYLIRYSVSDKNGVWFQYHFLHEPGTLKLGSPWVSGMAQGMMLSTFVNLYEATGDPYWKTWADRTFKTYQAPKSTTAPWFQTMKVLGGKKFLFFEEYPAKQDPQINHVVNGNIYAMYGLYDYYRMTGNGTAQWLFDTAASSMRDSFGSYRNPGKPSWYAATYYGRTVWGTPKNYHNGVISELRMLGKMTGDRQFTSQADTLYRDYH